MRKMHRLSALLALCSVAGCVSMPSGPSVLVLPGSGKNFDQFRGDDSYCKQYASEQVGGVTPNQASVSSGVASAAVEQHSARRQARRLEEEAGPLLARVAASRWVA